MDIINVQQSGLIKKTFRIILFVLGGINFLSYFAFNYFIKDAVAKNGGGGGLTIYFIFFFLFLFFAVLFQLIILTTKPVKYNLFYAFVVLLSNIALWMLFFRS